MGTVRIHVACEDRPPFEVDAIAIEDDTYSVLSADPTFHESTEHPIRTWTAGSKISPPVRRRTSITA